MIEERIGDRSMDIKGIKATLFVWLRIARLQFYPMTWLAYTMGAVAEGARAGQFKLSAYCWGYLLLFLIELCTILVNEYNDYDTDRLNHNFSIFTGGTRVLVEGKLGFQQVRHAIAVLLILILGLGYVLHHIGLFGSQPSYLIIIGLFLGLGYTMPPLKFSYRGLGEIVVSTTHSIYVILCGFVFQGGTWDSPWTWFVSIPLFFSIFGAITLAGIPDRQADEAVGKRTLAVLFGSRIGLMIAIGSVGIAYLSALLLGQLRIVTLSLLSLNMLVLPHGAVLVYYLSRLAKSGRYERRINREMGLALSYIIWFGLIPLCSFRSWH
jgi:1,4-dihydroxy-2-naphthoate polyprenyltransferase